MESEESRPHVCAARHARARGGTVEGHLSGAGVLVRAGGSELLLELASRARDERIAAFRSHPELAGTARNRKTADQRRTYLEGGRSLAAELLTASPGAGDRPDRACA